MNFSKILFFFVITLCTLDYSYADLIAQDQLSTINKAIKTEISSYDDLVEIREQMSLLDDNNKILSQQLEKLKLELEQKQIQDNQQKQILNQTNELFFKLKNILFSNSLGLDLNYDKALVALESMSLDVTKKYLTLVTQSVAPSKANTDSYVLLNAKANLLLGYIDKIKQNFSSSLTFFSAAYGKSNNPDVSLLSLQEIMSALVLLNKNKEACITYTNYKNNLQAINSNKIVYDKKLVDQNFIKNINKLCK